MMASTSAVTMAPTSAAAMASTAAVASSTPVYNSTVTAPLAAMSPTDHGGLIAIINTFGLAVVLSFLIIRISVQKLMRLSHKLDDYFQYAATVRLFILPPGQSA